MRNINDELMNFINKTPNSYACIENLKEILVKNNFEELYESDTWLNLVEDGKYFVTRNDSSLVAFKMCQKKSDVGFNITISHPDSPGFMLKPNAEIFDNNYLKLNVAPYGGMINYSWLDRPLSIAGRIIVLCNGTYKKHIINIDKDLLVIPSEAIHINAKVNDKCELNPQKDMIPIIALDNNKKIFDILTDKLKEDGILFDKICDYDLFIYNREKAKYLGLNDEFILAPRLDDLACVYSSLASFLDSTNKNAFNIFCTLNNEEIGSLSVQGADSTFLINTITRIAKKTNIDLPTSLNKSLILCIDNTHAVHPNNPEKNDPTNKVYLNKGIVIEHHPEFTTDALTSSIIKDICQKANIGYQNYVSRSDMETGSTLGAINQSHVGVDSVDIGIPQLAMHSSNELIGAKDVLSMYQVLYQFYQIQIIKDKNMIRLNYGS